MARWGDLQRTVPRRSWGLLIAFGPQPIPATGMSSESSFASALVGDEYVLRVRLLPDQAAEPDRSGPLVVQLDPRSVGLEPFTILWSGQGRWPLAAWWHEGPGSLATVWSPGVRRLRRRWWGG